MVIMSREIFIWINSHTVTALNNQWVQSSLEVLTNNTQLSINHSSDHYSKPEHQFCPMMIFEFLPLIQKSFASSLCSSTTRHLHANAPCSIMLKHLHVCDLQVISVTFVCRWCRTENMRVARFFTLIIYLSQDWAVARCRKHGWKEKEKWRNLIFFFILFKKRFCTQNDMSAHLQYRTIYWKPPF